MKRALNILFVVFATAFAVLAQSASPKAVNPDRWDAATLDLMATLPIQENGRIKPLSAYAAQMLYKIHGRRDMKLDTDGDGKTDTTLDPTEWLLDVLFQPSVAADFPLFRIENVEVLDAIGIEHMSGQRFDFDYISYRQLVGAAGDKQPAQALWQLASNYSRKPQESLAPVEAHILRTNQCVTAYSELYGLLAPLYETVPLRGEPMRAMFPEREEVTFAEIVRKGSELADLVRKSKDNPSDPALGNAMEIASVLTEVAQRGAAVAIFPPAGTAADAPEWAPISVLAEGSLRKGESGEQFAMLDALQGAVTGPDEESRMASLRKFRNTVVARAQMRGEYDKVPLENYYIEASWHYQSLHWFVLAILVVAASWLAPRSKWLWASSVLATVIPLCMLTADVILRSVVRGRPPILNLYDTFLFIAAIGVLSAVVAEVITRRRVAIFLAPVFGAMLVMLARAFEVESGEDQMAPLQAVLDTNYYLATHVTSINMGYAAGMFASFLGLTWLVLNAIGFRRGDEAFHKSVVRATYGVTAFGLVFAVFGTIYGGVWANDSWGRFWGWDPKENGALMICIAQVALLHARMAGMVRDFGFCVAASLIGIVVAFSWFHVNLLGIGLHAYGFSSATKVALFWYYGIQGGLTGLGAVGVMAQRARKPSMPPVGAAATAR
jgi:ABC-type transport system involved in cytochrome c biogenesis permease subunit